MWGLVRVSGERWGLRQALTLSLSRLLSSALQGLLIGGLGLLLFLDLGDAGLLDIVKLILRVGLAVHLKIGLGRGEIVIILGIGLGIILAVGTVLVIVVVGIGRDNVVTSEVDVVVANDLEENLLLLVNGELEGLLVVLFANSVSTLFPNPPLLQLQLTLSGSNVHTTNSSISKSPSSKLSSSESSSVSILSAFF